MKKAVFFDIDGTLLNSTKGAYEITPEVKNSIKELQKKRYFSFYCKWTSLCFFK